MSPFDNGVNSALSRTMELWEKIGNEKILLKIYSFAMVIHKCEIHDNILKRFLFIKF